MKQIGPLPGHGYELIAHEQLGGILNGVPYGVHLVSTNQEEKAMKLHPSLTPNKIAAAVTRQRTTLDNPGFCVACGHEQDGCEPDARNYECESCGKRQVFGAEELLLELM